MFDQEFLVEDAQSYHSEHEWESNAIQGAVKDHIASPQCCDPESAPLTSLSSQTPPVYQDPVVSLCSI